MNKVTCPKCDGQYSSIGQHWTRAKDVDVDGDGTFELSVQVKSTSGEWHSQKNGFRISQSENSRLRIKNTSGGTADAFASGYEVTD